MIAVWLETITWLCLGIQAFHYIAYPACVVVLAKIAPRPWQRGAVSAKVSLITAAYNEIKVIEQKIRNVLSVEWRDKQIIFVSDGSDDGTAEIIGHSAGLGITGLEQTPRQGKAKALNRAVQAATGDILVFSDAEALLAPDAVAKLVRNFADASVGCVNGSLKTPAQVEGHLTGVGRSEGIYWRYENVLRTHESLVDSTVGISGNLLAVRRELFHGLPDGTINDDVFLGLSVLRQGYRVIYEPAAVCWQMPSKRAHDEMIRRKRMTAGRYQNLLDPSAWPWNNFRAVVMLFCHKFLRLLVPFFMITALAANTALLALPPMATAMKITLMAQLVFYTLASLGFYAEQHGLRWRLPALAYFITVGNLGSLGGFLRYIGGRQSVLWQKAERH